MVHKNYKWNISEENAKNLIFNTIKTILEENNKKSIHLDELILLVNNRTKHITFMNNNKKKNINNYINNIFGGMINFLDNYDDFMIDEKEGKQNLIIHLNTLELNDWVFVEEDE
jgi:hypothetical protein